MILHTFNLTNPSQYKAAQRQFALDLYCPSFGKSKRSKDTDKQIPLKEISKQLKKIRTDLFISAENTPQLHLLLALITHNLVDAQLMVSVSAQKGAEQWEQFVLVADLKQIKALPEKKQQQLIQAASHLGHFHSKPFNTLSSVQFCRDKNYQATGEFGFTENQLNHTTASLSISGGSNAFSAFYAILITRINGLSLAEHLIEESPVALIIQQFFSRFLENKTLSALQDAIQKALSKTACDMKHSLHVMDKQIALPIVNEQGECDYINITPIINPTVFAATSRSIFYVKEQSVSFINIELGGANPSNAGTAVGEVTGQNSRLKMPFPVQNIDYIKQIMFSLNKQKRCFWPQQLKNKLSNNLLQYANNPDISKSKKREILKNTVQIGMESLQDQINNVALYLHTLTDDECKKQLKENYYAFFSSNKRTPKHYEIWRKTLNRSFESLPQVKDKIDYQPIINEIKQQFNHQLHTQEGF